MLVRLGRPGSLPGDPHHRPGCTHGSVRHPQAHRPGIRLAAGRPLPGLQPAHGGQRCGWHCDGLVDGPARRHAPRDVRGRHDRHRRAGGKPGGVPRQLLPGQRAVHRSPRQVRDDRAADRQCHPLVRPPAGPRGGHHRLRAGAGRRDVAAGGAGFQRVRGLAGHLCRLLAARAGDDAAAGAAAEASASRCGGGYRGPCHRVRWQGPRSSSTHRPGAVVAGGDRLLRRHVHAHRAPGEPRHGSGLPAVSCRGAAVGPGGDAPPSR